jgi:predicted dehydrogenase
MSTSIGEVRMGSDLLPPIFCAKIGYQGDSFIISTRQGTERRPAHAGLTPAEAYQECFGNAQNHFIHCLRTGEVAENDARDNLKTFVASLAAYESAASHQVVTL